MTNYYIVPSVTKISVKVARLALVATFTLAITSCKTAISPPVPDSKPTPAITVDSQQIEEWLEAAYRAFTNADMVNPPGLNASTYYEKVLTADPGNIEAQRGIGKIAEFFMEKAADAISKHYWATARSMLDTAYVVNPTQPGIQTMKQQIKLLSSAKVHEFKFDPQKMQSRDGITAKILQDIGKLARLPKTRVFVRASDDRVGRWMFQQLNKSKGDGIIRGEIQIGRPPMVRILELQSH